MFAYMCNNRVDSILRNGHCDRHVYVIWLGFTGFTNMAATHDTLLRSLPIYLV